MSKIAAGVDALLMGGRIIQVRPVLKQDREELGALYARASSRSRYLRFFTAGISIDREVQRLIAPADDHVALLAEHDGLAVGVASYEILSDDQAEFAVLVDDAWQGEGIGSLLIEQLAAMARRAGIRELIGHVLASNVTMLRASADLAPGIARDHDEDLKWFGSISQPCRTSEHLPQPDSGTVQPNTTRCARCSRQPRWR